MAKDKSPQVGDENTSTNQTPPEPKDLAAEMIRQKLESIEQITSNTHAHTQTMLEPSTHAQHVSQPPNAPAPEAGHTALDPNIPRSQQQGTYHDSLYRDKPHSPYKQSSVISPTQILHKSSERLKKIKPPKSFLDAKKAAEEHERALKEAHEKAKQEAASKPVMPPKPTTIPAQASTTVGKAAITAHPTTSTQTPPKRPVRPNPQPTPAHQQSATKATDIKPRQPQKSPKAAHSPKIPPSTTPVERSSTLKRKPPEVTTKKRGRFRKPVLIALIFGFATMILMYNEIAVAQVKQYITPSSSITTPVITDPNLSVPISGEARIVIPKINVDVPVVYDITSFEESAIQDGLERGVVHYGTTALPGQVGNNVIVGHSSNNFFNSGKYKFAFVLLDRLEPGDTFYLDYRGERYVYEIFEQPRVIDPTDFSAIQPTEEPITTLITCSPPGTSWRRLIVQGRQILPTPGETRQNNTQQELPDFEGVVPGNPESLWSRIFN